MDLGCVRFGAKMYHANFTFWSFLFDFPVLIAISTLVKVSWVGRGIVDV